MGWLCCMKHECRWSSEDGSSDGICVHFFVMLELNVFHTCPEVAASNIGIASPQFVCIFLIFVFRSMGTFRTVVCRFLGLCCIRFRYLDLYLFVSCGGASSTTCMSYMMIYGWIGLIYDRPVLDTPC
jgi:hypothetical protein